MELKDLLNVMIKTFFIVTTGTVLSVAVFCSVFSKDAVFTVYIFWQILLLAVLTTLPSLVFFSPKELSKKGWLVREAIHLAVLIIILFYLGYIWGWIAASKPMQLALYLFLIIMVYLVVKLFVHQSDKRVANQLNTGLNKYNDLHK
ncbi:MAG: DUF3021 family protein [Deltaproteobacteria bacterium]